jgi:hypothetical protein
MLGRKEGSKWGMIFMFVSFASMTAYSITHPATNAMFSGVPGECLHQN